MISGSNGDFFKISFKTDDLKKMLTEVNEKGYINLVMSQRKEISEYGQTHTIAIDDWKPKTDDTTEFAEVKPWVARAKSKVKDSELDVSDIPF